MTLQVAGKNYAVFQRTLYIGLTEYILAQNFCHNELLQDISSYIGQTETIVTHWTSC